MMQRLRATNERVQRSAARCIVGQTGASTRFVFATDTTNATAWMLKPCVPSSAICTHGKYYARRLQEIPT